MEHETAGDRGREPESRASDPRAGSGAAGEAGSEPRRAPEAPPEAARLFGAGLDLAVQYADILADAGVRRGLIGPREVERLWERHLLNCGVLAELVPEGAVVHDVGSGGGLPGIPLALVRPDLHITLVEPLLRRTTFLDEVVRELGLTHVEVLRGRAEEVRGSIESDVVTARAVAPLSRLAGWGLPLLRSGGEMLALKGDTAAAELQESEADLRKLGAVEWDVVQVGSGIVDPLTTVVRVRMGEVQRPPARGSRKAARSARSGAKGPARGGRSGRRG
ncbi:16S rRNA (guanine(527)-N(7))-methyltransferase RsmG [Yinghuangia soli]|uniref:Ribosomal RNA small subunit methyltransferase G n=1 Tax=Yinghuangia soli TaxID=2908204 RepID=A0AA41U5F1_9ACTN|nr:16S rRNA (guanine(527)-N(7))-methyltransferase RsmG [Yinghuangia soli]MCF2533895.1 16S rRNA (guanine(527)-N(7))-methyltransferase RsmG [Yinghuangia soli]